MGRQEIYTYTKPLTYKSDRVHTQSSTSNPDVLQYITDNYNFPQEYTLSKRSIGRSPNRTLSINHHDYMCIDPYCYNADPNLYMSEYDKYVDVTKVPNGLTRTITPRPDVHDWVIFKGDAPDPLPPQYVFVDNDPIPHYSWRVIDARITFPKEYAPLEFRVFRDNPTLWHIAYDSPSNRVVVNSTYDIQFFYYKAYTIPDGINVTYHVYANSRVNNFTLVDYIDSIEVWVDAIDMYHNGMHIVLPSSKIYETDSKLDFKALYIDCDDSDWRFTWERHFINIPGLDFTFKSTKFKTDLYRNNSDTPSTATVATGSKLWFHVTYTGTELEETETLSYTCTVNGTYVPITNGWASVNIVPESTYNYTIECTKYVDNVIVDTYTINETFSTLTALMYFDKDGNFGIGAYPEDDSVTCNALNLYEPGYTDYEYPLFSFREKVGLDNYNCHSLLFKPTAPVVEDGALVTITGKFTLIQILYQQSATAQGLKYLKKPSVHCTLVDGSGELWNIPESAWTCEESYPIGNYADPEHTDMFSNRIMYQIQRVVYIATTSVTIDTSLQLDKESAYSVQYYDYADSSLTGVNYVDADISYNRVWKGSQGKYVTTVTGFSEPVLETVLSYETRTAYEHNDSYDTTIPVYEGDTGIYYGAEVLQPDTSGHNNGTDYSFISPRLVYGPPYTINTLDLSTLDYSDFDMQTTLDDYVSEDTVSTSTSVGSSAKYVYDHTYDGMDLKEFNKLFGWE